MLIQDTLQQEVTEAVRKSLTFDITYQRIKPDISRFIAVTSMLPLKNLDDWERLIGREISSSIYTYHLKHQNTERHQIGSLRWMDICNADGFRRESALKTLSGAAPNRFLLALAVRKLNDWVPQIRAAARDALTRITEATDPELIVDVLMMTLPWWNSWGRAEGVDKDVLVKVLSRKDVAEKFKNRLLISTSGPAARLFVQAGCTGVLDDYLSEIAEKSVQPALRAKAYRCLLERRFVWAEGTTWQWVDKVHGIRRRVPVLKERVISTESPLTDYLRRATIDRSPVVRRIAGEITIKELDNLGEEAFRLAGILASDPSPSVAERGRYALADLQRVG